jgi:molecular chaperone DnaJ
MAQADYYKTLGVDERATEQEIKKSFRKLAKEYHPDRNQGDAHKEKRFKEISEAYETLSDKKKRSEYDNLRRFGAFDNGQRGGHHSGQPGAGPFGAGGYTGNFSGNVGGMGDLGDILGSIFGGAGQGGFRRTGRGAGADPFGGGFGAAQQKGADVSAVIRIEFEEAINGAEKQVIITDGVGGRKTIKVKIPKGIDNGEKIRLRGLGAPGSPATMGGAAGPAGDLIVTVNVNPHQKFSRDGSNIISKVTVSFKLAALGGKATVDTLTRKIRVTIPPGTQPGSRLRLKGQGLALGGKKGDLIVEVQVEVPTELSDEQKEALDKF